MQPGSGHVWFCSQDGTLCSRGAGIQGPPLSHSCRLKGQKYLQGSEATEGARQNEWWFSRNASFRVCCELPFAFLSRQKSKASGSLQPRSTRHGLCRASHREFGFSDVDVCSCSLDCLPRSPTTYWQARGSQDVFTQRGAKSSK